MPERLTSIPGESIAKRRIHQRHHPRAARGFKLLARCRRAHFQAHQAGSQHGRQRRFQPWRIFRVDFIGRGRHARQHATQHARCRAAQRHGAKGRENWGELRQVFRLNEHAAPIATKPAHPKAE
jgi:hypothetical protein